MITTVIISTILTLIATKFSYHLGKKNAAQSIKERVDDGSIPYEWKKIELADGGSVHGYRCPKCPQVMSHALEFCECTDYYKGHFHFQCNRCKIKCIMRTKDNK